MNDYKIKMLNAARTRARKGGWAFNLTLADINIPELCPVLHIPLRPGVGGPRDYSPSLDRYRQEKGYVRGNVAVISYRANAIKGTYSIEQLRTGVQIASMYDDNLSEWRRVLDWMECCELLL
jgi:hypothetical protein